MDHAHVPVAVADHAVDIEIFTVFLAARTEHHRMACRSVKTLVERRQTRGDKLQLTVRQSAIFVFQIANCRLR